MMSAARKGHPSGSTCRCKAVEFSVAYQAEAAATMPALAVDPARSGTLEPVRLRIDLDRVRRWQVRRESVQGIHGRQYTAVFEPEPAPGFEGVLNARIEELPGCVSFGPDLATARRNLREALDLYLEDESDEEAPN